MWHFRASGGFVRTYTPLFLGKWEWSERTTVANYIVASYRGGCDNLRTHRGKI